MRRLQFLSSSTIRHLHTSPRQQGRSFPATFARGGTSNGLVIRREHLPPLQSEWPAVLAAAMGSPDPWGRQLDGMGSGVSSTSKVCVISRSERGDADVDFTFVQVGVKDGKLDVAGNCGNMSAVVGPVAWDEGVVEGRVEGGEALVRIWNTNTGKMVHAPFRVDGEGEGRRFEPRGEYEMDGVPGTGSRVTLSFLRPAGAGTGKGALPSGMGVDELVLAGGDTVEASLVDVSNPGVFVRARDLAGGRYGDGATPVEVEADEGFRGLLEEVRRAGAERMGLDPEVQSVPKVVMVFDPPPAGGEVDGGVDVRCLAMSMGQAHKAVPLTLALCLGAAAGIEGTIPYQLRSGRRETRKDGKGARSTTVVIGHPSGTVEIGTTVEDGEIVSAELHRTARVLMKGEVFY
ncbi:DUF453-domain-containing protein [Coniochaeta ligniaria NRRL 30616]|uniref:DUF453-domain-containing protein n=1 Tax=Coniochaeta ligniaria NRRL 30616 TaxID=1408157 RepID=A0A1J7J0A1_9PEZI|nr:DUF453-domain-containing protein [Coniochaeta ligniaria NRRL 30616]